jgi:hypothetical protein
MNKVNNNFLDDNTQYQDSDTEEVIEEVIEEVEEDEQEAAETASVISEALQRIEQAKLYEALLNHQLFAPNSARPEVIKAVRKEFKEFIQFRLEVLLGMRADAKVGAHNAPAQSVRSPFSDEETAALKDIAAKLVAKGRSVQSAPTINSVSVPQPQIQALSVNTGPQVQEVATPTQRTTRTVTRRVVKRNGQVVSETDVPQQAPAKRGPRPKTNNVNPKTGQDYGQAAAPDIKPVPMPSQIAMDNMNANLAHKNMKGQASLSSGLGQAMQSMLKAGG